MTVKASTESLLRANNQYQKRLERMSEMMIEMQRDLDDVRNKLKETKSLLAIRDNEIAALRDELWRKVQDDIIGESVDVKPTHLSRIDYVDDHFEPEHGSPASYRHNKAVFVSNGDEKHYFKSVFDASKILILPTPELYKALKNKGHYKGFRVEYFYPGKNKEVRWLGYETKDIEEIQKVLEPLGEIKRK